ncbi:unnamed protein product [Phytophthora fragariaefolia]|uniref:Unnamed protein product n=1 Tax=Phytophthora fragariaefolia TaxID=1490495 RepID=A0A9W7D3Z5_9STRA|nr:unnamed protein product [Phytophthora fragariaefolia]
MSLSERETRYLVRTAAKRQLSAKQLKEELKLSTSVRTIQRVLAGVDWLVYTKMDNTLPLSAEDKRAREAWAWEMLMNKDPVRSWETIIFSDEKKWNLDGPNLLARSTPSFQANEAASSGGRIRHGLGWLQRRWQDEAGGGARQAELGRQRLHPVRVHAAVRPQALRNGLHISAGRRIDSPLQAHAGVLRGARGSGAAVAGSLA